MTEEGGVAWQKLGVKTHWDVGSFVGRTWTPKTGPRNFAVAAFDFLCGQQNELRVFCLKNGEKCRAVSRARRPSFPGVRLIKKTSLQMCRRFILSLSSLLVKNDETSSTIFGGLHWRLMQNTPSRFSRFLSECHISHNARDSDGNPKLGLMWTKNLTQRIERVWLIHPLTLSHLFGGELAPAVINWEIEFWMCHLLSQIALQKEVSPAISNAKTTEKAVRPNPHQTRGANASK